MLERIFASLFRGTHLTVGFINSSALVLRKSDKVKTLSPTLGHGRGGQRLGNLDILDRVPADQSHNQPEAGHLKEAGDAKIVCHTEVLTDTGASSSKGQSGALFQSKKNPLPYFIILTGLSI